MEEAGASESHSLQFDAHGSRHSLRQVAAPGISFTGNARNDFMNTSLAIQDDGNRPSAISLGGFFEDTDVRNVMPTRSGFDIRTIYFEYDLSSDVLSVGVDCYGVCGDADGDGFADSASTTFAALGGVDTAALSAGEFFFLALDTSAPPPGTNLTANVLIGSEPRLLTSTGYDSWGVWVALHPQQFPSSFSDGAQGFMRDSNFSRWSISHIEQLTDPASRVASYAGDPSFGDIEFTITSFSSIPDINWNATGTVTAPGEPGYGKMAFSFVSTLGSVVSLNTVGIDFLPNQTNGLTVGQRIVIECPHLPLDPFGNCCNFSDRDFCGVCEGNNAFLDVCGSCRLNASDVLPTSCPGAASQSAELDTPITPLPSEIPSVTMLDLNNDGIQEIVLGFPDSQVVVIQFYNAEGNLTNIKTISNPNEVVGNIDQFGFSVSPIGDVNGDGVPDLTVGAPGYSHIGRVYVLLLSSTGDVLQTRTIESIITTPFTASNCSGVAPQAEASLFSISPVVGPPNSPSTPSSSSSSCVPEGVSFGSSIIWLGRSFLLISAPGAPAQNTTPIQTSFAQQGALLLVALATDGNAIGTYVLPTILSNSLATTAELSPQNITRSSLGKQVTLAGTISSASRLVVTLVWHLVGSNTTSLLAINVQTDGSVTSMNVIRAPETPLPLPYFPNSPLLNNTSLLPPNYVPSYIGANGTNFSLVGAGDVDGDGIPDIVIGFQGHFSGQKGLLMVCFLDNDYAITRTQLIGPRGVGHLMSTLPTDYVLGTHMATTSSTNHLGPIVPMTGSTTLLVTATRPYSPLLLFPISLWGTSYHVTPGSPASPPAYYPGSNLPPTPFGISPSSLVPPSPQYPLDPKLPADPVTIEFFSDAPIITVTSLTNSEVWAKFAFSKIVERSSQDNAVPLKSLYFPPPSTWTKQVSSDNTQVFFSSKLVDSFGATTSVDVQVQVITFSSDKVITFSPTTYLGATKNTVKFSLQVRGWTFTQPKTVLDIIMDTTSSDPVLGITMLPSTSSVEQTNRFIFATTEGEFSVSIPSFASVDGILTTVATPTFNQAYGQFTITAPPFFDTLFYDPDVTIRANEPERIKKPPRQNSILMYIIVPSGFGLICIVALIVFVGTWICKHRKAERRWKDAGSLTPSLP